MKKQYKNALTKMKKQYKKINKFNKGKDPEGLSSMTMGFFHLEVYYSIYFILVTKNVAPHQNSVFHDTIRDILKSINKNFRVIVNTKIILCQ